jgi:hypothetical protein
MKNLNKFSVQELSSLELKEVQGGFLFALAAAAGIVYLVGEMAYIAGRQASNCD